MRYYLASLLLGGAVVAVAVACSSFSTAAAPAPADAGEDTGAPESVVDAEAPDAATACDTVTFDLDASIVGTGWSETARDPGGVLTPSNGGVDARIYADHVGARAFLAYSIPRRETVRSVAVHARLSGVSSGNADTFPALGWFASDDGVAVVTVQALRLPDQRGGIVLSPPDGGTTTPLGLAPIGSFPDGDPFDITFTVDGAWHDGATVALESNGFTTDSTSAKIPPVPEDGGTEHSLELAIGILSAPPDGATLGFRDVRIDVCRVAP